ncbi:MAG: CsgG/HfaB family protein [Desulfobacterales bacterium]|jgi:tetratricopeptide (TPR) repeat protein
MKAKGYCHIGMVLMLTVVLGSCASGKKQFESGMQLSQAGKYEEAMAHLEQAIAQEPKNERYQKALSDLKESLIRALLKEADQILTAQSPPSISTINKAKAKLARAKEISPTQTAVIRFGDRLRREENALSAKVRDLHGQANKHIQSEQWLEAYSGLQQIQRVFPGYEDTPRLMKQTTDRGSLAFYKQGKAEFEEENFTGAADFLRKALTLKGEYPEATKLLALAMKRDNKDYFVEKAEKAAAEQRWNDARKSYDRALEYAPQDQSVIRARNNMRSRAAIYYVRQGKSHIYAGWLLKAFENWSQAFQYAGSIEDREVSAMADALGAELTSKAALLANRFKDAGHYGAAWYWYEKIKSIDPDYPDIFYLTQAMEDEIIRRLKKSIAVFDFGPPSYAPDAGMIFANNLSTYLFKTASRDIKILERENLKSILDEMKLGQIGVVSSQNAKEMGRVYGIDVMVMGSVLRYNVDSTSYSDTKTVAYQVKKTEENIEYLNWKARNPNPTKEQLDAAPIPFIHKMVDVEKEYKVSTHKKVAFVTVSFRIVDVKTGENILVDTISRTKVAKDETSAGVQIAAIKYDPLEIPTDTELLQELTNEVVSDLGREALQPLNNLEKTYFESGEEKLRRREKILAVENFVNAIFDEKVKMIQNSTLKTKALQHLEDVFRNYKEPLEG